MGISKILDILVSGVHTHIPLFDQREPCASCVLLLVLKEVLCFSMVQKDTFHCYHRVL